MAMSVGRNEPYRFGWRDNLSTDVYIGHGACFRVLRWATCNVYWVMSISKMNHGEKR